MDEHAMDTYVVRVVDDAEKTFGAHLNRALLEAYAREAVLDLWLRDPGITVHIAELALSQIRDEIARRSRQAA
jgi:hypothetical protein